MRLVLQASALKAPLHGCGYLLLPPTGLDRGDHVKEPLFVNGVFELAAGQERLEFSVVDGWSEQGLRRKLLEARDLDVPDLIELQQPLSPCKHVTQEGHAAFAEWGQVELSFLQSRLAKELTYIAEDGEQVLLGRDLVPDGGAVHSLAVRGLWLLRRRLWLGWLLMRLM